MHGNLLVTATLLDSFEFAIGAPPSWRERAESGFISLIRREKKGSPAWVSAGQGFEDAVTRVCNRSESREEALSFGSESFSKVVDKCYGGIFRQKLSRIITVDEHNCFLFGYSDVEQPGLTIDIKTCLKWKGPLKYLKKNQHKVYLYINGKPEFEYIVAEWADDTTKTIKSVNFVPYKNPGSAILELELSGRIRCMIQYIQEQGLWLDYYQTFSKN